MCLIIETKKEIEIPKFVLDDMSVKNDDGFGFMYRDEKGVIHGPKFHCKKEDQAKLLYDMYLKYKEFNPYIHLRWRTHGDINTEQSHPFYCGFETWLMHNGTMSCQGDDKTKSDTWYLANEYLKPIFEQAKDVGKLIQTAAFQRMLWEFIGAGNRIVLMHPKVTIKMGSWHTIDNEETKCVGIKVSNTYAWGMHTKKKKYDLTEFRKNSPVEYGSHSYGGVHWPNQAGNFNHTYNFNKKQQEEKRTPPMGYVTKAGDPEGSFRDEHDRLWVYYRFGWILKTSLDRLEGIVDIKEREVQESKEVTRRPPPSLNDCVSPSNENIGKQSPNKKGQKKVSQKQQPSLDLENEEDDEERLALDIYYDWLSDEWSQLTNLEILERVKNEPLEAADLISFQFGIEIEEAAGIRDQGLYSIECEDD